MTFTENAAATMKLRLRERLEEARARRRPAPRSNARGPRRPSRFSSGPRSRRSTPSARASSRSGPSSAASSRAFASPTRARPTLSSGLVGRMARRAPGRRRSRAGRGHPRRDPPREPLRVRGEGLAPGPRADAPGGARPRAHRVGGGPRSRGLAPRAGGARAPWPGAARPGPSRPTRWPRSSRLWPSSPSVPATSTATTSPAISPGSPRSRAASARSPSGRATRLSRRRAQIAFWTTEASVAWNGALGSHLHARLVRTLLGVIRLYEEKKKALGVLDFLDLLLLARDALRDSDAVRAYFASRFRFVIIDEFQDTDPLQVEIAELLSQGSPGAPRDRGRREAVDLSLPPRRGRAAPPSLGGSGAPPGPRRAPPDPELPLARRHPALRQPGVLDAHPGLGGERPARLRAHRSAPRPSRRSLGPRASLRRPRVHRGTERPARRRGRGARRPSRRGPRTGGFTVRDPVGRRASGGAAPATSWSSRRASRRSAPSRRRSRRRASASRSRAESPSSAVRRSTRPWPSCGRSTTAPTAWPSWRRFVPRSSASATRDIVAHVLSGGSSSSHPTSATPATSPRTSRAHSRASTPSTRERLRLSVPALVERLYDATGILASLTGDAPRGVAGRRTSRRSWRWPAQPRRSGALTLRGFTRLLEERASGFSRGARPPDDAPRRSRHGPHSLHSQGQGARGAHRRALRPVREPADPTSDVIPLWGEGKVAVGFVEGCRPPAGTPPGTRQGSRVGRGSTPPLRGLHARSRLARRPSSAGRRPRRRRSGAISGPFSTRRRRPTSRPARRRRSPCRPRGAASTWQRVAAAEGGDATAARWSAARRDLVEAASQRPFVPVSATRFAARTRPRRR